MASALEAARLLEEAEQAMDADAARAVEAADAAVIAHRRLGDAEGTALSLAAAIAARLRSSDGGALQEAQRLAQEELEAARDRGDAFAEAVLRVAAAEISAERGCDQTCADALRRAIVAKFFFAERRDKELELRAVLVIAGIQIRICGRSPDPRHAKEALAYAGEALGLASQTGNRRSMARALYLKFLAKMYCEASWKDCVRFAKQAAVIFGELGCKWWEGTVLRTVADWALMRGHGTDGLLYAQRAAEIFRDIEGPLTRRMGWEVAALATLIGVHAAAGADGVDNAIEVAEEGASRLKASGDKMDAAQACNLLTTAYVLAGEYDAAARSAEEALALFRDMQDLGLEAQVLYDIAEIHAKAGNPLRALEWYKEAAVVFRELGDVRQHARSLAATVQVFLAEREHDEALEAASEAIALYRKCENRDGEGLVLMHMAAANMGKDEYSAAVAKAEEAMPLFVAIQSGEREAQCWRLLAEAFMRSDRHHEALNSAMNARAIYQKMGDPALEADALHVAAQCNMAIVSRVGGAGGAGGGGDARRRGRKLLAAAQQAGKQGLALARGLPAERDPRQILQCNLLAVVAQAQGALGKYKDALSHANEALRISVNNADRAGECSSMLILAQVHFANSKESEAKTIAARAFDLARKLQDTYLESVAASFINLADQAQPTACSETEAVRASELGADSGSDVDVPYAGPTAEAILPKIRELALNLLGEDELYADMPLMDSGLDSLSMVQFRNTLQHHFPGVPMPASMIFDHPSVRAVAENIEEELRSAHKAGRPLM